MIKPNKVNVPEEKYQKNAHLLLKQLINKMKQYLLQNIIFKTIYKK